MRHSIEAYTRYQLRKKMGLVNSWENWAGLPGAINRIFDLIDFVFGDKVHKVESSWFAR